MAATKPKRLPFRVMGFDGDHRGRDVLASNTPHRIFGNYGTYAAAVEDIVKFLRAQPPANREAAHVVLEEVTARDTYPLFRYVPSSDGHDWILDRDRRSDKQKAAKVSLPLIVRKGQAAGERHPRIFGSDPRRDPDYRDLGTPERHAEVLVSTNGRTDALALAARHVNDPYGTNKAHWRAVAALVESLPSDGRSRGRTSVRGRSAGKTRRLYKPSTRDPGTMSAADVNNELDVLSKAQSANGDDFIAAGRGYERPTDYAKKTDPLSLEANAISDRRARLHSEIQRRAGPGVRRMPKGFGPNIGRSAGFTSFAADPARARDDAAVYNAARKATELARARARAEIRSIIRSGRRVYMDPELILAQDQRNHSSAALLKIMRAAPTASQIKVASAYEKAYVDAIQAAFSVQRKS